MLSTLALFIIRSTIGGWTNTTNAFVLAIFQGIFVPIGIALLWLILLYAPSVLLGGILLLADALVWWASSPNNASPEDVPLWAIIGVVVGAGFLKGLALATKQPLMKYLLTPEAYTQRYELDEIDKPPT